MDNPVPYKIEDNKLPKIDFEIAEYEPKNYFEKKEETISEITKDKKLKEIKGHNKKDSIPNKQKGKNAKTGKNK